MDTTITIKKFTNNNEGLFYSKTFNDTPQAVLCSAMEWVCSNKNDFDDTSDKSIDIVISNQYESVKFVNYSALIAVLCSKLSVLINKIDNVNTNVAVNKIKTEIVNSDMLPSYMEFINRVHDDTSKMFPGLQVKHIKGKCRAYGFLKIGSVVVAIARVGFSALNYPNITVPRYLDDAKFILVVNHSAHSGKYSLFARSKEMKSGSIGLPSFMKTYKDCEVKLVTAINNLNTKEYV